MTRKHTKVNISDLDILIVDPSWTDGTYPIDDTPENPILIGLIDTPDVPIPVPPAIPESKEPFALPISPFAQEIGAQTRPSKTTYPLDRELPGTPRTINIESMLPEHIARGRKGKSLLAPFLYNTIDKWLTPPDLDNIGGYIGEILEAGIINEDYIEEKTAFAKKHQLQPSVRSFIDGNTSDLNMTWIELLNQMRLNGLDVDGKADKMFATQKFSYQPPVSPEKFVNFRYFYWTKNLGRWDIELDPLNEFGLILTNGSLAGFTDFAVGDYIRIHSTEFVVTAFDNFAGTINVLDTTENLYLDPFTEYEQELIGYDRPVYNVQAPSEYIANGWITNNHWRHIDAVDLIEGEGIATGAFPRAQLPIIEISPDVILDDAIGYTKGAVPNVKLYPLQHVSTLRTGLPINVENKLVGFDGGTGLPLYEEKEGIIPVISKPVLEYKQDTLHLDGEPTEIDPILGFNAVKLTKTSDNYIFKNGLLDDEHTDFRDGRFYVYLTQVSIDELTQRYMHTQTTLSNEWIITHDLGFVPIVRVYLITGQEVLPSSITSDETTTTITFVNMVTGIASFT